MGSKALGKIKCYSEQSTLCIRVEKVNGQCQMISHAYTTLETLTYCSKDYKRLIGQPRRTG